MELWVGALNLGLLYAFLVIGTFITYKVFSFPDITVDGSFATGASVSAVLITSGYNPLLSLLISFMAGAIAGFCTAIIHTQFKINGLLSGILVMTGLYSINLRIMNKSNLQLLNSPVFVTYFQNINPGVAPDVWLFICIAVVVLLFWIVMALFFKTDAGITMRATGDNQVMVAASGVNVNRVKIFGISLANGFAGVSGALVAQYQGFSDVGMGTGVVVFSLASVIIGETMLKKNSMFLRILSVIIGSIVFRLMLAVALFIGLNPNDLKLITALFVLFTLIATGALNKGKPYALPSGINLRIKEKKRFAIALIAIVSFIILGTFFFLLSSQKPDKIKVGLIIGSDADIYTLTRNGFIDELKRLGYENNKNIIIKEQNANGDISAVNTIIDNFIGQKMDIFIAVSTVSIQTAANRIKDKPVVFATVANPFILGIGNNDKDHQTNITGTYGTMPIDKMIEVIRKIYKGKLKAGTIWNSSYANSESNIERLRKTIAQDRDMILIGATVTSTNDVYQTALSLVNKDIHLFILVPDITVFSSFESVVRAANTKKIPVFTGDVERLKDGALATYGYNYYSTGKQAARLTARIIRGEKTSNIPFERYTDAFLGINLDAATSLGITLPEDLLKLAKATVKDGKIRKYY